MPRSATLSVTSESHGRQLPMRKPAAPWPEARTWSMVPPRERSASIPCSPLLAAVTKLARQPLSCSGTSLGGVKTTPSVA